jgi:Helix-hairpin-helix domain
VVSAPRKRDDAEFSMTSWHHVSCFPLPRKFKTGVEMMSVRDFCTDILTDSSPDHDVLSTHLEEIVEQIEAATSSGGKRKSSSAANDGDDGEGGGGKDGSLLSQIKASYDAKKSTDVGEAKKAKKGSDANDNADAEIRERQVEAYGTYRTMTANELKPMLAWNKQVRTGTKDVLLTKCIDGKVFGRLGCCGLCGGRLKLNDDGVSVRCDGVWNEDQQYKATCANTTTASKAPRFQPWYDYDAPPTDEQMEEMARLIEAAKEGGGGDGVDAAMASGGLDPDVQGIIDATKEKCPFWDLSTGDKVVATAAKIVEVMRSHPGKKVDLPEGDKDAKKAVGTILMGHKTLSLEKAVQAIIKAIGFVENKQAKAAKKQAAVASAVRHPANAALVAAFVELSDYYFKESNANAGSSTTKVANALAGLDYEVTKDNALGLGKGKTKVANIGAKSAEKIHEFVSTGRMEKLDEKRANHGG